MLGHNADCGFALQSSAIQARKPQSQLRQLSADLA